MGFSGEAFGNLLLLLVLLAVIVSFGTSTLLQKRGVDITRRSVGLVISLGCAFVFIILPLWLTDLTTKHKLIITTLALAVGIGNYFAIDRMQRILREKLGDKKKEKKELK